MRKFYSEILFLSLLLLTNAKNLFFRNAFASDIPMLLMGDRAAPETTLAKIIIGTKLIMLSPILIIGILLILIYAICKITKKNINNLHLLLITGIIGIILFFASKYSLIKLQSVIDYGYDYQRILSTIINDKYALILVIITFLLIILFLYFLIKIIKQHLKQRKNTLPNQISTPTKKE